MDSAVTRVKLIPIELTFACSACNGRTFRVESEPHGRCPVICKGCGRNVGRWGDLRASGLIASANGTGDVVAGMIDRVLARRRARLDSK
jgi:hypothetical protein